MKIENLPITQVKPYWRNPRKNDAAVAVVRKSIEEFGMNQPIVVDGDHVIIVGHTRYKACMQLGWKKVPCLVRSDLPAEKVRAYRIADNKANEVATWDRGLLVAELLQIGDTIEMQPYFPDEDLSAIVRQISDGTPPPQTEIDAVGERLRTQFEGVEGKEEIKLACPHCSEVFYIAKQDFLRRGQ